MGQDDFWDLSHLSRVSFMGQAGQIDFLTLSRNLLCVNPYCTTLCGEWDTWDKRDTHFLVFRIIEHHYPSHTLDVNT